MKNLDKKKEIAAKVLKTGVNKVRFKEDSLGEIKEALTREDIKELIKKKSIVKKREIGNSGFRRKKNIIQKRKGRRKGPGSRKGKKTARLTTKDAWMNKIRAQRKLINELKISGVDSKLLRDVYRKAKGGFFRSRRHIKLYLKDKGVKQ